MAKILGVDYSHWQAGVDPQKLIDGGVSFAIVKEGEVWIKQVKSGQPAVDDDYYDQNMMALEEAQLPHGSYYFYHPSAGNSKQLRHWESLWKRHPHDFPPILDVEDNDGITDKNEVARQIRVILEGMGKVSGRQPIVYTRNGFWVNQVGNPSWSDEYYFWLAQYPKMTNKSVKNIIMHQFTDRIKIPGCSTMDGNYWMQSEEDFYDMTRKDNGTIPWQVEQIAENRVKKNIWALSRANRKWLEDMTR